MDLARRRRKQDAGSGRRARWCEWVAAESREKRRGRGRGDRGEKMRWEAALDEDEREIRWALSLR